MIARMKAILRQKRFKMFSGPYELNIVGVRSMSTKPNRFDDEIHVFYKVGTLNWNYHIFKVTTDPGTYWLQNPMYDQGTAILEQGQYIDAYQIGMHQGKYKALVQRKPVSILRDYDRDAVLDFMNGNKTSGIFGINIHRALIDGKTKYVDKHSAGCQVFEDAEEFQKFLALAEKHSSLYGNKFTYTLVDLRAVKRAGRRQFIFGTLTLAGAVISLMNGRSIIEFFNIKNLWKEEED